MSNAPRTMPSLEEVFISDASTEAGVERKVFTTLRQHFSESIAPLLLLREQDFSARDENGQPTLSGIGPKSIQLIKRRLGEHDLRLRVMEESIYLRAKTLYGSIDLVPIQALYVVSIHTGGAVQTQFFRSRPIALICMQNNTMTMGELTSMTKKGVRDYLQLSGLDIDDAHMRLMVDELRNRLQLWGLTLADETQRSHRQEMPTPGTVPTHR